MLAEAHRRLAEDPEGYVQHVYGETEAGGTSVLFVSPVPFESIGFAADVSGEPLPDLTWRVLEKIPGVVSLGGAMLLAVWWITNRRQEVALAATGGHASDPWPGADKR
jgi:formate dehydrogenase iron-sulfur subunit